MKKKIWLYLWSWAWFCLSMYNEIGKNFIHHNCTYEWNSSVLEKVHEVEREAIKGLSDKHCSVGDEKNFSWHSKKEGEGRQKEKQKEVKQRKTSWCVWTEEEGIFRRRFYTHISQILERHLVSYRDCWEPTQTPIWPMVTVHYLAPCSHFLLLLI